MTDSPPPFVHPVAAFPPGANVQTFGSWREALGMTEQEWRQFQDKLTADLAEIARARASAMRHAHEVWIL